MSGSHEMKALVAKLKYLVSLNDPENGGPYQGVAAAACVEAMKDAADAIHDLPEALHQMIALAEQSPTAGPSASHAEADLAWAKIEKARSILAKATASQA